MKNRVLFVFVSVVAILSLAAFTNSETVKMALKLKKGQVQHQTIKIDLKMSGSDGKENMNGFMKMGLITNNEITEVHDDHYVTAFSLERITLNFYTPDDTSVKLNFDSNVPVNPQFDPIIAQVMAMKLDTKLNKNGSVEEITGITAFFNNMIDQMLQGKEEQRTQMKNQINQYLSDDLINEQLASAQPFGFPDKAISVGEIWKVSNSENGMTQDYTFKIKAITADRIDLEMDGTIDLSMVVEKVKSGFNGTINMVSTIDRNTCLASKTEGKINFKFAVSETNENTSGNISGSFTVKNELK